MKFLLAGGQGYLGGRLRDYLLERGHSVTVTTRGRPASFKTKALILAQSDFSKRKDLSLLLSRHDAVIYLAGPNEREAQTQPETALEAGAQALWRICGALALLPRKPQLLYLSSIHVYGSPLRGRLTETSPLKPANPYSVGKCLGELILLSFRKRYGLPALILRLSNAFGAPAGPSKAALLLAMNDFCRQAVRDRRIVLRSSGRQERNFITVSDAVRAVEWLAAHPARWPRDGRVQVGSALQLSIRQAAERVVRCAREELGFTPELMIPVERTGDKPTRFSFSRQRLRAAGFVWKEPVDREIKETLRFYAQKRDS